MVISQEALNYLASGHGLRHEQDLWVVLRAGTVLHAPAHCAAGLRHFGHRYLHRASCSSTQQGPWPSPTLWFLSYLAWGRSSAKHEADAMCRMSQIK
ncbi:hypothetical protein PAHAL_9G305300 [Panicum hallii]|nr:hypothetical protein PAHAL_9G305300 [Panicum hallii]